MHVAIVCKDKANSLDLRMSTRAAHLTYLENSGVTLLFGGPLLADDAQTPIGSLFIGDFENLEAAKRFSSGDPYALAGLFESVTIHPTRKVLPTV
jgi:uncharacterized protein YciI